MKKEKRGKEEKGGGLPYPDTNFSPGAQRYIKRTIDSGGDVGIDQDRFYEITGRAVQPKRPDSKVRKT